MPYANSDKNREYQREHKRLTRAGDCRTPCTTLLPSEFRLRTARDVLEFLEQQVDAVRTDAKAGTLEKARTIGYLAGASRTDQGWHLGDDPSHRVAETSGE